MPGKQGTALLLSAFISIPRNNAVQLCCWPSFLGSKGWQVALLSPFVDGPHALLPSAAILLLVIARWPKHCRTDSTRTFAQPPSQSISPATVCSFPRAKTLIAFCHYHIDFDPSVAQSANHQSPFFTSQTTHQCYSAHTARQLRQPTQHLGGLQSAFVRHLLWESERKTLGIPSVEITTRKVSGYGESFGFQGV
jgi:hypothetical protein